MKTFNKISVIGAALLVAAFVPAHAEDRTMTQDRDQVRQQLDLKIPASDFEQSQNREQQQYRTVQQNQNQYRYMNQYRTGQNDNDSGSQNRQSMMDRHMQGNSMAGSMNRPATMGGSMAGGRR